MQGSISYGNMEAMELFLGVGNDTFNVTGTMARADGFRTITAVNTGYGNDTVSVSLHAGVDGAFALNTGAGDDHIDASSSTLPLVLFGGDGNDTILGGKGSDIIFGDRGEVDYYDAGGNVVTRLGLELSERGVIDPNDPAYISNHADPAYVPAWQTDGGNNERIRAFTRDADLGGTDTIDGFTGNDVIFGGAAGDTITASQGGKIIFGDGGEANLFGATNDVFSTDTGVGGSDHIIGGADGVGNIMIGGAGDDLLSGGSGNDVILGDSGYVHRDASNTVTKVNTLDPSVSGNDTISGGAGIDVIMGG